MSYIFVLYIYDNHRGLTVLTHPIPTLRSSYLIAPLAAERKQRARVRTLLQNLLHQDREAVEPLAHVGGAAGQINACRRRQRDHRARTDITRASASARSEERRVGKECVSTSRSRGTPYH